MNFGSLPWTTATASVLQTVRALRGFDKKAEEFSPPVIIRIWERRSARWVALVARTSFTLVIKILIHRAMSETIRTRKRSRGLIIIRAVMAIIKESRP